MSLIPKSWRWRQVKLAVTCSLCLLPTLAFLLLNCYVALLVCLLWATFVIKNAYFTPINLQILYARFFFEYLLEKPDLLSQLRPLGLDLFNSQLRDYSVAFKTHERKNFVEQLAILRSFKSPKMSTSELQSYEVMEYFLRLHVEQEHSEEFGYHGYLINQMMGAQSEVISFITKFHRVLNLNDAEAYLFRVQRIANAFDQLIEQQVERRRRRVETPRFTLRRVIDELEAFQQQLRSEPQQSPLVVVFLEKLNEQICSKDKQTELINRLLDILKKDLSPAYDRLLNVLHDDLSHATTDHGVWKLPNGDEFYKRCLEYHTTTNMSADEIHELGKKHVDRIQNEMRRILKEKHIDTWQDFRASIRGFEHDSEQKYPNVDESRARILGDYTRIIEDIDNEMHKYFSAACRPATKCVVDRVPQFKEATSPMAYYFPAALDGKTPGTFFANLRNVDEVVKFKMGTLAYHEAVPGHHFQLSVAQSLKHLPFFRRMVPFTAYVEGWALYTEQFAAEEGFHQSWYSYLGYLDFQLMRSCRLVVDTGIHWKRWSREEAIDYMTDNTCASKDEVVTEIERYFVMPGQACAYMIGCQTILSLRAKARSILGDRFDLKEFHDAVLLHGSLPLNMLEKIVDGYIRAKRSDM